MHDRTYSQALKELGVAANRGLSAEERARSRKRHGRNVITPPKKKSLFKRIAEAIFDPMLLILVFALLITFGVNLGRLISGGEASFYESLGILIAITISVSLTVIMEGRSKKAFELLNGLSDKTVVKVVSDGEIVFLPRDELAVGDIVVVEAGDKIVADGRLIRSRELKIDESTLTGESKTVRKNENAVLKPDAPLAERVNCVYSGTFVASGSGVYVVTAVGDNAEMGKLAGDLRESAAISAPLNEKLARLGKWVSILGGVAAAFVFILSMIKLVVTGEVTFDSVQNLFVQSIILIVAAVPEGLPSTMAISLTLNVLRLAKSNALIRKLVATETVGCVSVICSDKTGTLTENKMTVELLKTPRGGFDEKHFTDKFVCLNAAVNSTAELTAGGEHRGSETEAALLAALRASGADYKRMRAQARIVGRTPFSSEIKYMQTDVALDGETVSLIKGAPEIIVKACELRADEARRILSEISEWQKDAKRVIAFMHRTGKAAYFDGYAVLSDKLRADVAESIKTCKAAGIKVKMLTGDNVATASSIADKLGIGVGYGEVVTGDKIEKMTDGELAAKISGISVVARSTPQVKLRVVKALQAIGEVVAVTGDGVNDAPAVKNADIGIAMGSGSEITKEAGDIILLDNSFSTIITAISFGRNIFGNFQRFIMFQLTVNLSSMCIIIAYLLMGLECPFSSTGLLWLNIIMDGPLALSLGLEKSSATFLDRKPVKRSDNILSARIIGRIVVHAAFCGTIVILQELYNFLGAGVTEKSTVTFALFVIFQLFNALNCREVRAESAFRNFFGNKLLLVVGVLTFILQIIITQKAPSFFGTVPLGAAMWLKIILLTSTIVLFSEAYKAIYRVITAKKQEKAPLTQIAGAREVRRAK